MLGAHAKLGGMTNKKYGRIGDSSIIGARDLAIREGIFCGTSSGMNVAGALKLSEDLGPKSKVVTVACDSGLKYLSEGLFFNF